MPAATKTTKPEADVTDGLKKRGSRSKAKAAPKAKAPRGKVGAPKPPKKAAEPSKGTTRSKTFSPSELKTLEEYAAHEVALNADPELAVDVELMKKVQRLKPTYRFTPRELKALADSEKAAKPKGSSGGSKAGSKPRGESLISRIGEVLRESDGPMHVKDIVAAVEEKYGKDAYSEAPTPKTTRTQVQCDSAKKRGFTIRVDRGTFDLVELNPKGAKKRPAAK